MKQSTSSGLTSNPALTFGSVHLKRLGAIVRSKRLASGLSLKAVAEKSDLSVSTISALEAGTSSPSLNTFVAIISVLGESIDELVAEVLTETRFRVYRATGSNDLQGVDPQSGFSDMEVAHVCLAANSVQPALIAARSAHSMCMVTQGTVTACLKEGERYRLEKGDTYHAQPNVVEKWINTSNETTRIFCVID